MKIKELWLEYKTAIDWKVTLFWYIVLSLPMLENPSFYKFLLVLGFVVGVTILAFIKFKLEKNMYKTKKESLKT